MIKFVYGQGRTREIIGYIVSVRSKEHANKEVTCRSQVFFGITKIQSR